MMNPIRCQSKIISSGDNSKERMRKRKLGLNANKIAKMLYNGYNNIKLRLDWNRT